MSFDVSIATVFEGLQVAQRRPEPPVNSGVVVRSEDLSVVGEPAPAAEAAQALKAMFDHAITMAAATAVVSNVGQTVNNLQRQP